MPILDNSNIKTVTIDVEYSMGPQGEQGIQGIQGEQGIQGAKGDAGVGLIIIGTLDNTGLLPASGSTGDAYVIDGFLYAWAGTSFENIGQFQGGKGDTGEKGDKGDKGWTMSTVKERYGLGPDYKIIEKVVGYINGTGIPPDLYVDMYASDGGYTLDKDLALNFRGEKGQDGSGTIVTAPTVDAGGDKTSQLGVEQTFVATITPGSGSITSILWEQVSGTTATLSGQNTDTLKVNGFALGVSTFKVTVTDSNGLIVTDQVVLTGTNISTITAYFGTRVDKTPLTLGNITALTPVELTLIDGVLIPFSNPSYLFNVVAIPNDFAIPTKYQNTTIADDNGNIGTDQDLFGPHYTVGTFNVLITEYAVPLTYTYLLD